MADAGTARRRRRRDDAEAEAASPAPSAAPAPDSDDASDEDAPDSPSLGRGRASRSSASPSRSRSRAAEARDREERRTASFRTRDHRPTLWSQCAALFRASRALLFGSSDQYFLSRYQVASSMPLQMTLYFSIPYALVYAALSQYLYAWKSNVWEVPLVVAVISPMIFTVWALLEPIRLILGYVGNLRERVAWLGGFWVLTIFPQLVVHIYFLVGQASIGWITMPIETVMSAIYVVLSLVQLGIGYSTIRRLIAKAMADFHLQPVDEAADDPALTL